MAQPQLKRTAVEIQRAHDLLVEMLVTLQDRGELKDLDELIVARITASASAMCWMLGHEYNKNFAEFLESMERGMVLTDLGELQERE